MSEGVSPEAAPSRWAERLVIALLTAIALYTVYRAMTLRAEYWDAFLYLNNSRALLGDQTAHFQSDKPPAFTLLFAPTVALTRGMLDGPWMWIGPQLTAALLSFASAAAVFAMLRCVFSAPHALLGVLLVVGNRVFIRYGAMVMTDVWAMGITAAVFAAWVSATRTGSFRKYSLAGVAFGLAVSSRYQLATIPLAIASAELVWSLQKRQFQIHRLLGGLVSGLIGSAFFVGLHWASFEAMNRGDTLASLWTGFQSASAGALREHPHEEPWHYLQMLQVAVSPLVLGLAAVGLWFAARRRQHGDWLALLWIVFVGGSMFRVDHNEIRYLYPAFPAIVYFAVLGVRSLRQRLRTWISRIPSLAAGLLTLVILLAAVFPALGQMWRDQDPFFRTDVTRTASAWLIQHTSEHAPLFFVGRAPARRPRDISLFVHDEYFDVFHFGPHEFSYFTGRPMTEHFYWGKDPARRALSQSDQGAGIMLGTPPSMGGTVRELLMKGELEPPVEAIVIRSTTLRPTDGGWEGDDGWVLSRRGREVVSMTGDLDAFFTALPDGAPVRRRLGAGLPVPFPVPQDATLRMDVIQHHIFSAGSSVSH